MSSRPPFPANVPPPPLRRRPARRYTISGNCKPSLKSPITIDIGSVHSLIDPSLPLYDLLPKDKTLGGTNDGVSLRCETVTPTSQLGDTVVHVRQVSKLIGRARVKWDKEKTVMIITKAKDRQLVTLTREMVLWLTTYGDEDGLTVYVDANLKKSRRFDYEGLQNKPSVQDKLHFWTPELCAKNPSLFDFVVTLGGDGTVLFASWLFQHVVPPLIPFALGSLGFLTNFDFEDYKTVLSKAVSNGVRVNLRMRFTCTVYRCDRTAEREQEARRVAALVRGNKGKRRSSRKDSISSSSSNENYDSRRHSDPTIYATIPGETFEILNDLVVDRGPSPYMSMLELFGDDRHLTTVQADGLCVATPTGSTAYSLAAGGSLVHPEIPAMLISPICPHTLSFRPMLLPDSTELRVCVPPGSRSTAFASFDGRGRVELKQGEYIKIVASRCPLPTVCAGTQSDDWFRSLNRCLRWNERQRQRPFVCVESPVIPDFNAMQNDPALPPNSSTIVRSVEPAQLTNTPHTVDESTETLDDAEAEKPPVAPTDSFPYPNSSDSDKDSGRQTNHNRKGSKGNVFSPSLQQSVGDEKSQEGVVAHEGRQPRTDLRINCETSAEREEISDEDWEESYDEDDEAEEGEEEDGLEGWDMDDLVKRIGCRELFVRSPVHVN